jgi:hypothetical protein
MLASLCCVVAALTAAAQDNAKKVVPLKVVVLFDAHIKGLANGAKI